MSGLDYALRGDDAFFAAIDAADRDTMGIGCSNCDTYHIMRFSDGAPEYSRCPNCGSKRGWAESPALGEGPASIQQEWDDGGGPVIAALLFDATPPTQER